jgi:hypothetical protein
MSGTLEVGLLKGDFQLHRFSASQSNAIVNNEWGRIWKKVLVALLKYYSVICLERPRNKSGNLRVSGHVVEIPIRGLQNAKQSVRWFTPGIKEAGV